MGIAEQTQRQRPRIPAFASTARGRTVEGARIENYIFRVISWLGALSQTFPSPSAARTRGQGERKGDGVERPGASTLLLLPQCAAGTVGSAESKAMESRREIPQRSPACPVPAPPWTLSLFLTPTLTHTLTNSLTDTTTLPHPLHTHEHHPVGLQPSIRRRAMADFRRASIMAQMARSLRFPFFCHAASCRGYERPSGSL